MGLFSTSANVVKKPFLNKLKLLDQFLGLGAQMRVEVHAALQKVLQVRAHVHGKLEVEEIDRMAGEVESLCTLKGENLDGKDSERVDISKYAILTHRVSHLGCHVQSSACTHSETRRDEGLATQGSAVPGEAEVAQLDTELADFAIKYGAT